MIATQRDEYRALERETSNFLLEQDSRRALGRYEEAAYDALQAGRGRARMGQLCFASEQHAEAVEDWLSATACFLQATAKKPALELLEFLRCSRSPLAWDRPVTKTLATILAAVPDPVPTRSTAGFPPTDRWSRPGHRSGNSTQRRYHGTRRVLATVGRLLPILHRALTG